MSMEMCCKCKCPSTLTDTDYHTEIYRHGFDFKGNSITWTGKQNTAVPLCECCLTNELERFEIDSNFWMENYGY